MNRSDPQGQPEKPELIHCARYVDENGLLVDRGFDHMAAQTTLSGPELIAWANRRDVELKRRRVA